MVKNEDIIKQKLLKFLEKNHFKSQRQAYINYSNRTLVSLIQHLHDDHGKISPMEIEESEHKMKQELSLLYRIMDLFDKIEEGAEFYEAATTPIPGEKAVNS